MELKDTIELMQSENYKDRFLAEYYQAVIRTVNLRNIIIEYKKGRLDFELNCSIEVLCNQLETMENYICILEERASIEKIEIPIYNLYLSCIGSVPLRSDEI